MSSSIKIFSKKLNRSASEQGGLNKNIFRFYFDLKEIDYPIITSEKNINEYKGRIFGLGDDQIAESCQIITFEKLKKEIGKNLKKFNLEKNPQEPEHSIIEETFLDLKYLPLTIDFLDGSDKMLDKLINNSQDYIFDHYPSLDKNVIREIFSNWKESFKKKIQTKITQKIVPAIKIDSKDYNALSRIFETINSTGQSLTTFDLLVAKMSLWQDPNKKTYIGLRDVIKSHFTEDNLKKFDDEKSLGGTACQQLPRVISLKVDTEKEKSLKKSDILSIEKHSLISVADETCKSMNDSLSFLRHTLGVYDQKFLPFKDAITLASSIDSFQNSKEVNLFEAYYWQVVFTEDLEKDSNSTTKRLYNEWIGYKNGNKDIFQIKQNIEDKFPTFETLIDTDNKSSILYRAVLSFVFTKSKMDWKGYAVQDEDLEDHHIFPKYSITKNLGAKGSENYINTVLNKVLISKKANNNTRDDSPDKYLKDFYNLSEFAIPNSFKSNAIPNTLKDYNDCLEERYILIKSMVKERVINCLNHSK